MAFINRNRELTWFENLVQSLQAGKGSHAAILGLRRVGKTDLVLEFKRRYGTAITPMPYLNLQGSVTTPQRFCLDVLTVLLKELCRKKKIKPIQSVDKTTDLLVLARLLDDELAQDIVKLLGLIKNSNYEELFSLTFEIPERVAKKLKMKILFFLDEFQEIDALKYYGFGPLALLRSVIEKQTHVKYAVTGSVISMMEDIFKDPHQPFFNQFLLLTLQFFDKEHSQKLAKYLWKYEHLKATPDAYAQLFQLTLGHPFYITAVCERAYFEAKYHNDTIDESLVDYAFVKEVLHPDGKLNALFHYIYHSSLRRAQRKGALREPLLILAEKGGLTLSELSATLGKPSGQISNIVKSLLVTDLVVRHEDRYFFRDQVLRFWLAKTANNREMDISWDQKIIRNAVIELQERYAENASQLGHSKEFELYYFVNENSGKMINGIQLPSFDKLIKNYITPNGDEIDLLAFANKISWAFELKWRSKSTGLKDLNKFVSKLKATRYVYISKAGFTPQAQDWACQNNIILWEEDVLK